VSSDYVVTLGKKYKGKRLKDVPVAEMESYIEWLDQSDMRPGSSMATQAAELKKEFEAYKKSLEKAPAQVPEKGKRKPNTNAKDPYRGTAVHGNVKRLYFTEKGTELPLINLKGKEYLEVKYRLVWFREENPDWPIETEFLSITDTSACAKATIKNNAGVILATSHKSESVKGFPDFIEKAETGSIGRALALLGYGTQFCADELDEGKRIVDSPVGKGHPSEPVVPTIDNGPVVMIRLPKRSKTDEEKLRKNGFVFDWVSSSYLRYADDNFDHESLGFEFEVLEKPPF